MLSRKFMVGFLIVAFMRGLLSASVEYVPNLNEELSHNKEMIQNYKSAIKELEARNKYLKRVKKQNPKLYVTKPLYEDKKHEYIYRVKLNGAKAKNINFTVKNHRVFLDMNLKTEKTDKNGYYFSSQSFYQEFAIPSDVKESRIKNRVDGDYFEIVMPKK